MKQFKSAMFLAALSAVAILAQPPGGGRPGGFRGGAPGAEAPTFTEVKAALGLSDAQIQSLQQIQQQTRQAAQPLMQQIVQKQTTLRESLTRGTTAQAAGQLLLEIEGIRKTVSDLQTRARTQASGVLTADQRTKLKTLEDAMKLQPAIGQAIGLNLLTPATNTPGGFPGARPRGFRRPVAED